MLISNWLYGVRSRVSRSLPARRKHRRSSLPAVWTVEVLEHRTPPSDSLTLLFGGGALLAMPEMQALAAEPADARATTESASARNPWPRPASDLQTAPPDELPPAVRSTAAGASPRPADSLAAAATLGRVFADVDRLFDELEPLPRSDLEASDQNSAVGGHPPRLAEPREVSAQSGAAVFAQGATESDVTASSTLADGDLASARDADASADSSFASGMMMLLEENNPPEALNDDYDVVHDVQLNVPADGVLGNDDDQDEDELSAVLVSGPSEAESFQLNNDGSFTYKPNPGFAGEDSFTYYASDGGLSSETATVTIEVTNDIPSAAGDDYDVVHDTVLTVGAPGVLDNDEDDDPITATVVDQPTNGTLNSFNADGSFEYEPDAGFVGIDTFTYRISDGIDESELATVTIYVTNDGPSAEGEEYSTLDDVPLSVSAEEGVLVNDEDPQGDPLTAVLVMQAQYGNVSLSPDGSFTYTPNGEYVGWDSFQYRVDDPYTQGGVATVAIGVNRLMIELGVPDAEGDITWQDVTNATTNVWAGEQINLQTVLFGPGAVPMSNWSWTVPGDIFAGWIATTDLGAVVDVGPSAFSQPQLTFHWSSEGTYQVTVGVDVGNQRGTKSTTLVVDRPGATIAALPPNLIQRWVDTWGTGEPTETIAFGNPLGGYNGAGAKFKREPVSVGGAFQWVQVVDSTEAQRTLASGQSQTRPTPNGVLDNTVPYFAQVETSPAEEGKAWDTPHEKLNPEARWYTRRDDFTMYLMWKSDRPNSQWVSIQERQWSWQFTAESNDGNTWTLIVPTEYNVPEAGQDTTNHPEWGDNIKNYLHESKWE